MKKLLLYTLLITAFTACKKDDKPEVVDTSAQKGYPKEIADIFLNKCATSGCHNDESRQAAAGLSLSSWDRMFEGTNQNAVVIPYRADQSILQFFINTFDDLGPTAEPTMPYNAPALSKEEVIKIRDWINNGAPNNDGFVKYSDNSVGSKYYVLNSKCHLVAVFSEETNKIIRYVDIPVGANDFAETVQVSYEKEHWLILLTSGKVLQYSTITDEYLGMLDLGPGLWSGLHIIPSNGVVTCNYSGNTGFSGGEIVVFSSSSLEITARYNNPDDSLYFPLLGMFAGHNGFFISANQSNFIYNIKSNIVTKIKLNSSEPIKYNDPTYRPAAITYFGNGEYYGVACRGTNEIRVYHLYDNTLKKVIKVGAYPNEMVTYHSKTYVTCTEDEEAFPGKKGSVYVINNLTLEVLKVIDVGYQPKGIISYPGMIIIANRNADPVGADKPHHYTGCEGNNGYLTAIDPFTLERVEGFRAEVSVDPYSMAYR